MTSTTTEDYRTSTRMGITISYDPSMTLQLTEEASARINGNREWMEPNSDQVALHLSDLIKCIRKAWLKRRQIQKRVDSGLSPVPPLTPNLVIRFGRGYGFQDVLLGSVEEAVWSGEFFYSPDGGVERPIEVKTTLSGPLVKKEREAGLSIEDVINGGGLRDTYFARVVDEWKQYMLAVMKLMGWDHYWLAVAHWMGEDFFVYKVTATPEAIEANWASLQERLIPLKGDNMPSVEWRTGKEECEDCEFLDQCIDEGVLT